MTDLLNLGSIWVGRKPKDGDILTPHGNTFEKEEETSDRFRYDAKTDTLIPIKPTTDNDAKSK